MMTIQDEDIELVGQAKLALEKAQHRKRVAQRRVNEAQIALDHATDQVTFLQTRLAELRDKIRNDAAP